MRSSQVLLFDRGLAAVDRVASLLHRSDLEVHRVAEATRAVELVWSLALDLVVAEHPLPDVSLDDLVDTVRDRAAPSRRCGMVLVCDPGSLPAANSYLGLGVNRVVSQTDDLGELLCAVVDLLHVPPRISVRAMVQVEEQAGIAPARELTRTVDLSLTGMLVAGALDIVDGTRLGFELHLPGEDTVVSGIGRVVRHTDPEREQTQGIAIAFESFAGEGEEQLAGFLIRSAG